MDDGPDYYDVGWFKDSPSEIWGNNGLEELGWFGAILQILVLPLYILQFIIYLPFWIIIYLPFLIIMGIGKLFSSGSGDEGSKESKQTVEQINTQIGCLPKTINESEVNEYLILLQKKWQQDYENDPQNNPPPEDFPKKLKPVKDYIMQYGLDDAIKWMRLPSKNDLKYNRTYNFESKRPAPEQTNVKIDASDLLKKQENEKKEFFEKLEANLRKEMSESAYWQNVPEEKRDRQISRYMKEAKLDLKNLGIEKASRLWLGFIKKSDAKRDSHPCPPPV